MELSSVSTCLSSPLPSPPLLLLSLCTPSHLSGPPRAPFAVPLRATKEAFPIPRGSAITGHRILPTRRHKEEASLGDRRSGQPSLSGGAERGNELHASRAAEHVPACVERSSRLPLHFPPPCPPPVLLLLFLLFLSISHTSLFSLSFFSLSLSLSLSLCLSVSPLSSYHHLHHLSLHSVS